MIALPIWLLVFVVGIVTCLAALLGVLVGVAVCNIEDRRRAECPDLDLDEPQAAPLPPDPAPSPVETAAVETAAGPLRPHPTLLNRKTGRRGGRPAPPANQPSPLPHPQEISDTRSVPHGKADPPAGRKPR
jgi:hypothetical protein